MTIHVTTRCGCGGRGILCDDDVWGADLKWSVECDTCDAVGPGRATPDGADRGWRIMHGLMVRAAIGEMARQIPQIFGRPAKPIGVDVQHIPNGGTADLAFLREAWQKAINAVPDDARVRWAAQQAQDAHLIDGLGRKPHASADEMRSVIDEDGDDEAEGDEEREGGKTLHIQCAYWPDAPAPTAVVVTVEVDGEDRNYECRPVAPEPVKEAPRAEPVSVFERLRNATRCSCGAMSLSYKPFVPGARGHVVYCEMCGASTGAMASVDAALERWATMMGPKSQDQTIGEYIVRRDAQTDVPILSADPSEGFWPTFTAGAPTHTAAFGAPEAPIVTWGGASMALRPMADLETSVPALIMWGADWVTGRVKPGARVRLSESDDTYSIDEFSGWVPLPEAGAKP